MAHPHPASQLPIVNDTFYIYLRLHLFVCYVVLPVNSENLTQAASFKASEMTLNFLSGFPGFDSTEKAAL